MPAEKEPQTLFAPAGRDSADQVQKQSGGLLAQSLLRRMVDAVPDILLVVNDKRQIVFANQRLLDHLGTDDPRRVYGARFGEIMGCVHGDETAGGCGTTEACRHCGAVLAMITSQEGKADSRECRIRRKERGEALNYQVGATPIEVEGRRFSVVCVQDISSEKRRQVLERVLFEGILGGAHQVREEAAEMEQAGIDQLQSFRSHTFSCSTAMIEEVNEHRILTAAERGELRIHPRGVPSLEALKELVDFYEKRPEAQTKWLRIQRQARDTVLVTDPSLLKQVLGHMILNALEACREQEAVTLNVEPGSHTVEYTVHNPGAMPREAELQVFQRGYTTKGPGRGTGTYAMRLLAERYLKGRVSFVSTKRLGTVFRLALPETI